eukprot:scaffold5435_cov47-Phaeocystis_antarctica.AAC.4
MHLELRLAHEDLIGRVLDDGAVQHLAQVLRHADLALGRLAEGQAVVVVRQVRLGGRQLMHADVDPVALLVLLGCDARQVEGLSPRGLRAARERTQAGQRGPALTRRRPERARGGYAEGRCSSRQAPGFVSGAGWPRLRLVGPLSAELAWGPASRSRRLNGRPHQQKSER